MNDFQEIDTERVTKALLILKVRNSDIINITNRFMDVINNEGIRLLIDNSMQSGDELAIQTNSARMSGIDFAVNALVSAIIKEGEKQNEES